MVTASEAGKELLIDALLAEIVPLHENLRVWKSEPLETDTLIGSAGYLIAPFLDYLRNVEAGLHIDVYGIASNGQGWVFYRWDANDTDFCRTTLFGLSDLPGLLGALDHVCAACESQIPVQTKP
jgi:hypothetical protein